MQISRFIYTELKSDTKSDSQAEPKCDSDTELMEKLISDSDFE